MLTDFRDLEYRPQAVTPTFLLWALFLLSVALAAILYWGLATPKTGNPARTPVGVSRPLSMPHAEGMPTFADAAASMQRGRHAEAYGRFMSLADEGDEDAAQIALFMHRFGPGVFGSHWDASPEQLQEWTKISQAASARDIDDLRAAASGRPSGD